MGGSFIVLKTIFGFCPVFQDIHLKVCDPVCVLDQRLKLVQGPLVVAAF